MSGMALAALMRETRDNNGWSVRDVADQARQRGFRLDKTAVSDWENHGMATLVPDRVAALAAGLRVPVYKVAIAVLADKGIVIPFDARTPEDAIAHDHTLSPESRMRLIELLRAERSGNQA